MGRTSLEAFDAKKRDAAASSQRLKSAKQWKFLLDPRLKLDACGASHRIRIFFQRQAQNEPCEVQMSCSLRKVIRCSSFAGRDDVQGRAACKEHLADESKRSSKLEMVLLTACLHCLPPSRDSISEVLALSYRIRFNLHLMYGKPLIYLRCWSLEKKLNISSHPDQPEASSVGSNAGHDFRGWWDRNPSGFMGLNAQEADREPSACTMQYFIIVPLGS